MNISSHFEVLGITFDFSRIDAVAAGTLLLAIATGVLGLVTYRAVRAAQGQAETAQKTLDSEIRPLLVEVPVVVGQREDFEYPELGLAGGYSGAVHVHLREDLVALSAPFRNVGRGLAVVASAWIQIGKGQPGYAMKDLTHANVPVGERTRPLFVFGRDELGYDVVRGRLEQHEGMWVCMRYVDFTQRQPTNSRLYIGFRPQGHPDWEVQHVNVDAKGEPPPSGIRGEPPW